jgi:hypothetical protein
VHALGGIRRRRHVCKAIDRFKNALRAGNFGSHVPDYQPPVVGENEIGVGEQRVHVEQPPPI